MQTVEQELAEILAELRAHKPRLADDDGRLGSRYVGPFADEAFAEHVANGGTLKSFAGSTKSVPRRWTAGLDTPGLGEVMTRALAEGSASSGGVLVANEVAVEIVQLLRARSAIMRLGPRVVPVSKSLSVTSISSGAAAYYVGENAAIPVSEPTFAQIPLLIPKELAALVPVSNRLLRDAAVSPSVEQVLREDLAQIMALRQDLAFIQGTGTGGEPLGLRNAPGTTPGPSLGANGGIPDFDALKDLVGALRNVNAPFMNPGFLFNPKVISVLEKIKDSTGRYIADTGLMTFDRNGGGGTLLNFPFVTTTQIPTNITTGSSTNTTYIVFSSDWTEAWVGENESLTIEASSEATYTPDGGVTYVSAWQNRQTVFRAVTAHDFALRRPELFSVMTGVRV
jgi:HK97 family phage major capsid protein